MQHLHVRCTAFFAVGREVGVAVADERAVEGEQGYDGMGPYETVGGFVVRIRVLSSGWMGRGVDGDMDECI